MTGTAALSYTDLVLPPNIISRIDVARLVSELERIDNEYTTAAVRSKAGTKKRVARSTHSERLDAFLAANDLKLTDARKRASLIRQVSLLKDKLPTIHMTFAVEADPDSLERIVEWLRASIHPHTVLSVGLQPSLIAGVYIRTPNHVHDLSLRGKLTGGREVLVKELEAIGGRG